MTKTILEPARELPVYDECEVLVVGAGPAGVTAAVAARKSGAKKVILLERAAYLGGMATGGQVLLIPFLSDPYLNGGKEQLVAGLMNEWVDRLRAKPWGVCGPKKEEIGSSDPAVTDQYRLHTLFLRNDRVQYGVNCDPELLKVVLNEMVEDAGVITLCHCLGCRAIVEDGTVKGVIFESKEGRKAILAQVVIDCSGDGDVFASAGAAFEMTGRNTSRISNTALVFRLGGVSYDKYARWLRSDEKAGDKMREAERIAGYRFQLLSSNREDMVWVDNLLPRDCMTIDGLTDTAFSVTRSLDGMMEYLHGEIPGMERAYLVDFASQVGTRGSRRLVGTARLLEEDIGRPTGRDDIIAVLPTVSGQGEYPRMELPYGIMVPEKIDGLLASGRCFSSSEKANQEANWIPYCIALGEAAGTAAAIAVNSGVQPRAVNMTTLRRTLKNNGVYL